MWPEAGQCAPRLPEPPGFFGQFLAVLGGSCLWLLLELGVFAPGVSAPVPTLGHPLQPLLTPGLFLFPVALQMPEGLLMFACTIVDIIER